MRIGCLFALPADLGWSALLEIDGAGEGLPEAAVFDAYASSNRVRFRYLGATVWQSREQWKAELIFSPRPSPGTRVEIVIERILTDPNLEDDLVAGMGWHRREVRGPWSCSLTYPTAPERQLGQRVE